MARFQFLKVFLVIAVQVVRGQEDNVPSSRWYNNPGYQNWNNGFNQLLHPGQGFFPQQPGFVPGFLPGGSVNTGSGSSSFGNTMNTPWFNSQNNGANHYSYADSLVGAFSSFSQSWSTSMSSRKQSADNTSIVINSAAEAITEVGGKLGEHCLIRVLCESAVSPQRFAEFSKLVGNFVNTVGQEVPENLKSLVDAFSFGQGKSLQSCSRRYTGCKSAPSKLMSDINGVKL